jgi:hypothetical protein
VRYRHYLTFRWERASATAPREGWQNMNTDAAGSHLSNDELLLAVDVVRRSVAERLGRHPGEIVLFIVNHTAVTL